VVDIPATRIRQGALLVTRLTHGHPSPQSADVAAARSQVRADVGVETGFEIVALAIETSADNRDELVD
jgi:hypothetical protein